MRMPVSTVDEPTALPNDVTSLIDSLREEAPTPSIALGVGTTSPFVKSYAVPYLAPSETAEDERPFFSAIETGAPAAVKIEEVPKLERWTVQAHIYSVDVASKVSILGALFGGSGKVAKVGAVHEAKRFRVQTTDQTRDVEIGVAVRLAVAVTEWDTKFDVSLPNIAASAELEGFDGRIGIEVLGYSGPLGSLLPAPRQLDVTTCADYLQAFARVQTQVFGESGLPFIAPTLLSYEEEPEGSPNGR